MDKQVAKHTLEHNSAAKLTIRTDSIIEQTSKVFTLDLGTTATGQVTYI